MVAARGRARRRYAETDFSAGSSVAFGARNPVPDWLFGGDALSSKAFPRHPTLPMAKNVLLIEYEQRDRNRVRSLLALPDFDGHRGPRRGGGARRVRGRPVRRGAPGGQAAAHAERRRHPGIRNKGGLERPPILLLPTGYTGSNTKADAQKIGAFEIVPKPFTDGGIVDAVRAALDATDREAKTVRVPATGSLTSDDIFSDLLEELGRETRRRDTTGREGHSAARAAESGLRRGRAPAPGHALRRDHAGARRGSTRAGVPQAGLRRPRPNDLGDVANPGSAPEGVAGSVRPGGVHTRDAGARRLHPQRLAPGRAPGGRRARGSGSLRAVRAARKDRERWNGGSLPRPADRGRGLPEDRRDQENPAAHRGQRRIHHDVRGRGEARRRS